MNIENTVKTNKWRYIAATVAPFLLIISSLYLIVGYIHNEIDSTKSEIEGIHDIRQLHNATLIVQKVRGLTNIKLNGGDVADSRIDSLKKDANAVLKELIYDRHSVTFKFGKPLRDAYSIMGGIFSREGEDISPGIRFDEYSRLIDDLMNLKLKVANESKLVLDPELVSYYLTSLIIKQIPDLSESIGQARGIAAGIAVKGDLSKENSRRLIEITGHIKHDLTEFKTAGNVIFNVSRDRAMTIKALFTRLEDDVNNYLMEIERILEDQLATLSPMQIFDTGTAIIEENDLLFKEVSEQLSELFKKRKTRLSNILIYTFAGVALALALITYFIFGFYRSNRRAFISLRKYSDAQQKTNKEAIRYKDTLLMLSQLSFESICYNFSRITELASQGLMVKRASIWLYTEGKSSIVCSDLYLSDEMSHENGSSLSSKDFPLYFNALKLNKTIRADDAGKDPHTHEFAEGYLKPFGIVSILDIPIWCEGEVVGVICCEHIGEKRIWTDEEEDFLKNVALFVTQTLDTDKRLKLQERRAELISDLEYANKDLKDFAYIVSHDLKAPLRGIGSLASWIWADYADKFDKEGKEHMKLLTGRVERMNNLIDGILQYSKTGRSKLLTERVDLTGIAKEVIDSLSPPDNISITVKSTLPVISCDRTQIFQIFLNLVSNAVKYMDKSKGEIEIDCSEEADEWRFSVSDNGPGIDEQYFEKIFHIFQTLSPRDEVESTGVGLSVVKKIVEMYNGRVWVESSLGEGSRFFFSLPKSMIIKG